jgi:hypothetical protein
MPYPAPESRCPFLHGLVLEYTQSLPQKSIPPERAFVFRISTVRQSLDEERNLHV